MTVESQQNELLKLTAMDARDVLQRLAERIDDSGGAPDAAGLLGELGVVARLHARRLRIALKVGIARQDLADVPGIRSERCRNT